MARVRSRRPIKTELLTVRHVIGRASERIRWSAIVASFCRHDGSSPHCWGCLIAIMTDLSVIPRVHSSAEPRDSPDERWVQPWLY
jgi:hypothetical protein